jgi:Ca-activated chloride channel homolog
MLPGTTKNKKKALPRPRPVLQLCSVLLCTAFLCLPLFADAQKEVQHLRGGNRYYNNSNFKDAEIMYRKSLEARNDYYKGLFNLGDAMYRQQNYEEAAGIFERLAKTEGLDKYVAAKAYHNYGNALMQQKKFSESMDAYKNALKKNPKDVDTKYNLEYARMMIRKQEQQQNQQQDKQQDQQQDQKDDQQQQQDQQQDQQQQEKQQAQPQDQISKEDAERMLNALRNQEQKTLEKLRQEEEKGVQSRPEKDW